jgi:hypothetical protein
MHSLAYKTHFPLGTAAFACVLALSSPAVAAQLVVRGNCSFVEEIPGIFSSTRLTESILKGAILTQDRDGRFCGMTTMQTPFGPATSSECFVVGDGRLVSAAHDNKVSSSDCALTDQSTIVAAFDSARAAAFAASGPANLHGQAFLKTLGGDVKTCAGEDVFLLPGMSYFDEAIEKTKSGIDTSTDQRAVALLRHTLCDAQGNFSFSDLPATRWYVLTQVRWGVPHIEQPGERPGLIGTLLGMHGPPDVDQQGGELLQAIELHPGDNQVFLTSRDEK